MKKSFKLLMVFYLFLFILSAFSLVMVEKISYLAVIFHLLAIMGLYKIYDQHSNKTEK